MKKGIYLFLVVIISMIINVKDVMADDLTCTYGKGNVDYKLVQSNGKHYLYESYTKENNWQLYNYNYELIIYDEKGSMLVDFISYEKNGSKKTGTFSKCPGELAITDNGVHVNGDKIYTVVFYYPPIITYTYPYEVYSLIPSDSSEDKGSEENPVDSNVFYYQYNNLYNEEVNKNSNKWIAKCSYYFSDSEYKDIINIYFNEDKYILINENSKCGTNYLDFTIDELNKTFREIYKCPVFLYMSDLSNDPTGALNCNFSLFKKGYANDAGNIESSIYISTPEPEPEPEPIKDCKGLFGEKLVEQINKIMNIVKIAVPILLIAFGIIDFTKAVFAGNEDNMKKVQKTFFNRIIAAVLVFIAPIFINLILTLANEVWGYINPETCIEQSK